jgi:hypothetical protein
MLAGRKRRPVQFGLLMNSRHTTRVAKAAFKAQRLLAGERLLFDATNPAQLPPGHYRAFSSFEFERKILTSAGEFTIPE